MLCHAGKKNLNKGQAEAHYYTSLPIENIKNKLIVPVKIKGKEFRFLLDTGGPCAVSEEIKTLLAPKKTKKARLQLKSDQKQLVELLLIDSLELGGVLFTETPSLVRDFKGVPYECLDIDGLLGSNLLRNSILHINLQESTCILTDSIKAINLQDVKKYALELSRHQSNPLITVEYHGKQGSRKEKVLFDSGVEKLLTLSSSSYTSMIHTCLNPIATDTGYAVSSWAGRYLPIAHLGLIPYMRFADFRVIDVLTQTEGANVSVLGAQILESGNLTLDYLHKKFYFSTDDTVSLIEPILPYTTVLDTSGQLRVGYVWDELLKNQLQSGDQILSVDSQTVNNEWLCKKLTTIATNEKSTTRLKVKKRTGNNIILDVQKTKPNQVITEFIFPPIDK